MRIWRQLRWRIIAAQIVVVIVGVVVLAWVADAIAVGTVTEALEAALRILPGDEARLLAGRVGEALLASYRQAITQALLIAALAATAAGVATSLLLTREILRPLREIGHSSQRIAAGHYDERVTVPGSDELAAVAHNFNLMADTLAQVEQQRITLIGNVAHELRTPLAGLEGYLEGLIDGVVPDEPATFSSMQREVRRLHRLVNDLQTLSRVEAGQVSLQLSSFDLLPLVQHVLTQLQPQAGAQQLALHLEEPAAPVQVYADPDRTSQMLLNLVGNAIRYTPAGGSITLRLTSTNRMACLTVTDTGVGIPAEALPYIFERFYRVDRSRARSSGGSGIGLTIARHLAWAMGGDITASSPGAGQGSSFCLTLPLATGDLSP